MVSWGIVDTKGREPVSVGRESHKGSGRECVTLAKEKKKMVELRAKTKKSRGVGVIEMGPSRSLGDSLSASIDNSLNAGHCRQLEQPFCPLLFFLPNDIW